jgi:transposase
MRSLEQESNPEVLRLFTKWVMSHNERLHKDNERLRQLVNEQVQESLKFEDQLLVLRKLIFGKKSEKRNPRPRGTNKDEVLLHSQSLVPDPTPEEMIKIPEEIVYHSMRDEELIEEAGLRGFKGSVATDWEEIKGLYDESSEVTVIERSFKKILHRKKKYRFKAQTQVDKQIIVSAPGPTKLICGGSYSIKFATTVIADKYLYHLPLERQCREIEALGLHGMKPMTLYQLVAVAATHLEPVKELIREDVLTAKLTANCDETPWPITDGTQKKGQMWIVSNQAGSYYRFEHTRSGQVIEELLQGYRGPVMNDGLSAYNRLKKIDGIVMGNCWAHARRKFNDIKENYPNECNEILDLIDKLFAIERRAKTYEQLIKLREQESASLTKEIFNWLVKAKPKARSQGNLRIAIVYLLKRWKEFTTFLTCPQMPLSNNDAERALRHAVMGRKNFYGSRSFNGADVAATLYTVIESCKKVQLDPKSFIEMAIRRSAEGESPITPMMYAKQIRGVLDTSETQPQQQP